MSAVAYKVFVCRSGHQWDVFGYENEDGEFVPDGLQLYLCPTCDSLKVQSKDPENLT